MILIAFKQNRKGIIASFITLFLYTYALGGFITTLSSTTYQTSFGVVMSCKINLYLICMIIIAITYIFELVAKHIKFKLKTNNLIYKLTLKQNNEHLTINAFMDTGNLLNIEGKPVIILDLNCFLKLNKSNLLNFYLSKSEEIKTQTVTGNNNLKIFQIDELNVNYENKKIKIEKPYIAVNTTDSFKNCNYQALLSPAIL